MFMPNDLFQFSYSLSYLNFIIPYLSNIQPPTVFKKLIKPYIYLPIHHSFMEALVGKDKT
jgi:hypothetical protein